MLTCNTGYLDCSMSAYNTGYIEAYIAGLLTPLSRSLVIQTLVTMPITLEI
jgi:hypothetical protein